MQTLRVRNFSGSSLSLTSLLPEEICSTGGMQVSSENTIELTGL